MRAAKHSLLTEVSGYSFLCSRWCILWRQDFVAFLFVSPASSTAPAPEGTQLTLLTTWVFRDWEGSNRERLSLSQYKIYQSWTCSYFGGLRGGPQVANVLLCCHLFRVLWHKKFIIYQKPPALYVMSLDLPTKLALRFVNHQRSLVLCSGQWWSFKFCGRQCGTLESAQETSDSSDFTSNWLSGLRHLIQLLLICFLICKMRELN